MGGKRKHASPIKAKVERVPNGTPQWKLMQEYYLRVAADAEAMGKNLKAWWYRRKARREFFKGRKELDI